MNLIIKIFCVVIHLDSFFSQDLNWILNGPLAVKRVEIAYVVSVYRDRNFACPGVILSKNWILTPADCVDKESPERIIINAGSRVAGRQTAQWGSVKQVVSSNIPPGSDDIALLELKNELNFNEHCNSILPISDRELKSAIKAGNQANVIRWGNPKDGTGLRDLEVYQTIILNEAECLQNAPDNYNGETLQICTKSVNCEFLTDLGDLLVVNQKLAGIKFRTEYSDCDKNLAYSKISLFEEFINSHIPEYHIDNDILFSVDAEPAPEFGIVEPEVIQPTVVNNINIQGNFNIEMIDYIFTLLMPIYSDNISSEGEISEAFKNFLNNVRNSEFNNIKEDEFQKDSALETGTATTASAITPTHPTTHPFGFLNFIGDINLLSIFCDNLKCRFDRKMDLADFDFDENTKVGIHIEFDVHYDSDVSDKRPFKIFRGSPLELVTV